MTLAAKIGSNLGGLKILLNGLIVSRHGFSLVLIYYLHLS